MRKSFVERDLAAAGAVFEPRGGAMVAVEIPAGGQEAIPALALADRSPLPRLGVKGRDALAWLRDQGVEVGEAPNRGYLQPDGAHCTVLGATEALLLGPARGDTELFARLGDALADTGGRRAYPIPRTDSHFEFQILGHAAPAMLAKLCAVDLRPAAFEAGQVAQTSVARSNAVVIREDLSARPAYRLLGDSASARYMWRCLLDAMGEFGGRPVGLNQVGTIASQGRRTR